MRKSSSTVFMLPTTEQALDLELRRDDIVEKLGKEQSPTLCALLTFTVH